MDIRKLVEDVKMKLDNKKLSESSLKIYISNIKKLHKFITGKDEVTDLDFIYEEKKIEEFLKEKSISTQRNYYTYILALLNYDNLFNDKKNRDDILKYAKRVQDINKTREKQQEQNIVSEKKKEKQIPLSELNQFVKEIKDSSPDIYIIINFIMKYYYRNEAGKMKLIDLKTYNKQKKKLKENYLVVGARKMMVSRNDYKTYDVYGNITNTITDKSLKAFIRKYIKEKDLQSGDVLFNYGSEQLSNRIAYLSQKKLNVKLGSASIFKIVMDNFVKDRKYTEVMKKLQEVSKLRGTTVEVLRKAYVNEE
mgnify:FL=1